jgi:hypothetical protein
VIAVLCYTFPLGEVKRIEIDNAPDDRRGSHRDDGHRAAGDTARETRV